MKDVSAACSTLLGIDERDFTPGKNALSSVLLCSNKQLRIALLVICIFIYVFHSDHFM